MLIVVVLDPHAPESVAGEIVSLIVAVGASVHRASSGLLTVLGGDAGTLDLLRNAPGVRHAAAVTAEYPLASLAGREGAHSEVRFGTCAVGPGSFSVIAGPCSVESLDQIQTIARSVRAAG